MRAAAAIALLGGFILAGEGWGAGGGTSGAEFLRVAIGARPAALGESFVGLADDVTAAAWNPAGLGRLKGLELAGMHLSYLADTSYEFMAAGLPAGKAGGLALSAAYVGVKPFDSTVSPINPAGTAPAADATDAMLAFSWGFPLTVFLPAAEKLSGLYAGISAKYIYRSLGGYVEDVENGEEASFTGSAFAADLGVLYQTGRKLGLGACVQNVGSPLGFLGEEGDSLPMMVRLGASYLILERDKLAATILADLAQPMDPDGGSFESGTWGGGGVEFTIASTFSLRAGFRQGPDGARVVGGAGLSFSSISLDYAFVPLSDLGVAGMTGHRMGLRLKLGSAGPRRLQAAQGVLAEFQLDGRVRLSWEEVPGAAGYHLEFKKPEDADFRRLTKKPRTENELSLRGMKVDNEYALRVIAVDGKGIEGRAAEHVFVPKAPELPSPARVEAKVTGRRVDLSWPAVMGAAGYHVYYRRGEGGWKRATKQPKKTTSAYLRGLTPMEYQFAVRSVGPTGIMSKARAVKVVVQ